MIYSDLLLACSCFFQRIPKAIDDLVYVTSRLLDNGNPHVSETGNVSEKTKERVLPSPDTEVAVLDVLVQSSRDDDALR